MVSNDSQKAIDKNVKRYELPEAQGACHLTLDLTEP